jgi:hypothetical protein
MDRSPARPFPGGIIVATMSRSLPGEPCVSGRDIPVSSLDSFCSPGSAANTFLFSSIEHGEYARRTRQIFLKNRKIPDP